MSSNVDFIQRIEYRSNLFAFHDDDEDQQQLVLISFPFSVDSSRNQRQNSLPKRYQMAFLTFIGLFILSGIRF